MLLPNDELSMNYEIVRYRDLPKQHIFVAFIVVAFGEMIGFA